MPRGVYMRSEEYKKRLRQHLLNVRGDQKNENNPMWKGDKVSYHTLHRWVTRHKGRPMVCEHCNTTESKRYEWANVSRQYKRQLDDWIRLCSRCHHKFDNQGQAMKATRIKKGSFIFYGNQYKEAHETK